jgi:hypothetical protein
LYDLSFHPDHNLFLLRFSGRMTIAEGKAAFLDIMRHDGFHPDVRMLTDTRAVTEAVVDFAGIFAAVHSVLGLMSRFGPGARSVILVGNDTHFGMARMLEQVVDALARLQMRVVSSVAEGAAQVGLSKRRWSRFWTPRGPCRPQPPGSSLADSRGALAEGRGPGAAGGEPKPYCGRCSRVT